MFKKLFFYTCFLSLCLASDSKPQTLLDASPNTLNSNPSTLKGITPKLYRRSLENLLCWKSNCCRELLEIDSDSDINISGKDTDMDYVQDKSKKLFQVYVGAFCLEKTETYLSEKRSLKNCGEDGFFISKKKQITLGVADGVGGEGLGISREISTSLMSSCKHVSSAGKLNASSVLKQGYDDMMKKKPDVPGSTTATIVSIQETNGDFDAANFGDSGFLIIRNNESLLLSKEMIKGFNYPVQLRKNLAPENPETYKMNLKDGDIIVLATDGLWDNLFIPDILEIVSQYLPVIQVVHNKSKSVAKLAKLLTRVAKRMALSSSYNTPFSEKAKNANFEIQTPGKNDDTTVLVAYVNKKQ